LPQTTGCQGTSSECARKNGVCTMNTPVQEVFAGQYHLNYITIWTMLQI
jgi:hypothetical protein